MRAAFYETNGAAADVLRVGEVATPSPGPGEVRVRLKTSGVNPSDVKSRAGLTRKIAFPRVIPHSDGAGEIDKVGRRRCGDAHRRARLDLERPMEARVRHGGRIYRAAAAPGGAAAGQYQFRHRRRDRHSRHDGVVRRNARRPGARHDRVHARRRRCGRLLRHPVCEAARRTRHHHREFAGQGANSRNAPAPIMSSTTSATMSPPASPTSPARRA